MQIKVICECKQKFAFEVEPKNGRMPFAVNCPVCGRDGTTAANAAIAVNVGAVKKKSVLVRPDPIVELPVNPHPPIFISTGPEPVPPPNPPQKLNLPLGIVGAICGALLGSIIMVALRQWFGLRLPLLGIGIGFLAGYGAPFLAKGKGPLLGIITAAIAFIAVLGTLFLASSRIPLLSIFISLLSAGLAYKLAGSQPRKGLDAYRKPQGGFEG